MNRQRDDRHGRHGTGRHRERRAGGGGRPIDRRRPATRMRPALGRLIGSLVVMLGVVVVVPAALVVLARSALDAVHPVPGIGTLTIRAYLSVICRWPVHAVGGTRAAVHRLAAVVAIVVVA